MNSNNISIETVSNGFIVTENPKKQSTSNCGCSKRNDGCQPFTVGGYIVPEKLVFSSYSALMQWMHENLEHIEPQEAQVAQALKSK